MEARTRAATMEYHIPIEICGSITLYDISRTVSLLLSAILATICSIGMIACARKCKINMFGLCVEFMFHCLGGSLLR